MISVGNLHWGGGGKTPITAAIARYLRDQGFKLTILSRGHGRTSRGPLVVSRGNGPLVEAAQSGDEPALLARIKDVNVVVAEQRFAAGQLALKNFECDLFLLDDGFSHVALARDIEILVFPHADPLGGARLLPTGRLREPLAAAQHAHAIILTGLPAATDATPVDAVDALSTTLDQAIEALPHSANEDHRPKAFGASTHTQIDAPRPINNALLVCAVARAQTVIDSARTLAAEHSFTLAKPLVFRDHHPYPRPSLKKIRERAQSESVDTVLVTGKDMVKLDGRLELPQPMQLVEIQHRAALPTTFYEWLTAELAGLNT